MRSKTTGRETIAKTGAWILQAERREPGDLNAQVDEILSSLTHDTTTWLELSTKYQPDLFLGLFLKGPNEGIELSSKSVSTLAERGISIGFDIYSAFEDADAEQMNERIISRSLG